MKLAAPQGTGSMQAFDTVKMEDRKRSAVDEPRNAHPPKRQAVSAQVNGTSSHPDADMPWKDNLEEFTKDAIFRQMREYKRMAASSSQQIDELQSRNIHLESTSHRINEWYLNLVDELAVTADNLSDLPSGHTPSEGWLCELKQEDLEAVFGAEAGRARAALEKISTKVSGTEGEPNKLRQEISKMRARQNSHNTELSMANAAKAQLEKRLEDASIRYIQAEKKLDRMKSTAVQKIEAAAKAPPANHDSGNDTPSNREESDKLNGVGEADLQSAEVAKREALAAKEKIAEQLSSLQEDHHKLTEKLTTLQLKQASVTDEDYAGTELYKTLRVQHEDVIRRVNDLQATNIQLREEVKKMYSERTSYKDEADKEAQESVMDVERQIGQAEADITRLRNGRDELQAQLSIVNAKQEQERDSIQQAGELHAAQAARISTLEAQIERLQAESEAARSAENTDSLSSEEMAAKIKSLESTRAALEKELSSMGAAWQKAQSAATKKWTVLVESEDRVAKASAEKAKAEQKYFATAKAKDMQSAELKQLRMQNSKTAEIMSQLKEVEQNSRSLISQLEKQLAEAKDSFAQLNNSTRTFQQEAYNNKQKAEQLATHTTELEKKFKQKDADSHAGLQARHKAEQEMQELQVRHQAAQKSLESLRERSSGSNGTEFDVLKGIATCSVCRHNFKNTALKTCGHVFCDVCIQERVQNRARKCPNCNKAFGTGDTMRVTL